MKGIINLIFGTGDKKPVEKKMVIGGGVWKQLAPTTEQASMAQQVFFDVSKNMKDTSTSLEDVMSQLTFEQITDLLSILMVPEGEEFDRTKVPGNRKKLDHCPDHIAWGIILNFLRTSPRAGLIGAAIGKKLSQAMSI